MSGGQCNVPVTIRSIGGATGRFGTQHSATGESWYIGLPGLKIATAGTPAGAYSVLRAAIRDPDPVIFFEHKGLYARKGLVARGDAFVSPVGRAEIVRPGADVTVVATLLMADRALRAADDLASKGIDAEVIDLRWLRPLDRETVAASLAKTRRLVIVEEQVHTGGWGSAVVSDVVRSGVFLLAPPQVVSLPDDLLIPYSPSLEDEIVPSAALIGRAIETAMVGEH
jgi:acetoin:2,6-dichlorophenolindophenol oxidoreductase subunit beta